VRRSADQDADVIIVGAGPSGATTAYHLARAGLQVLLFEKTAFPREKVCGDGLTPRAVKELVAMGIDVSEEAGWLQNKGLRIYGGGMRLELPWPDLAEYPGYGLVRKRTDFDETLARQAEKAGAILREQSTVTGAIQNDRTGRVEGVTVKPTPEKGPEKGRANKQAEPKDYRAPLVIAADGNSSRLSVSLGLNRREDRPMGVAVRTYFTSPRHDDDWLESWLELWDGPAGRSNLLPGYGWIFGMGDGTSNVGLGLRSGATGKKTRSVPCVARRCRWVSTASPTIVMACCWWVTPAAWSTR
jgi:geranylgeranyl reductase family protein